MRFGAAQFFDVFARYNSAVWPLQVVLVMLALVGVGLAARPRGRSDRVVVLILAFLWLWMGAVYHLYFFRAINPAATLFGGLFLLEAFALGLLGLWRGRLRFRCRATIAGGAGAILVAFALVAYPIAAYAAGHRYPATATFGLPCPTTILTLGLLLWAEPPVPWAVLVVPLAWSAVGASAALQLGVREDLGLVAAGVLTLFLRLLPRLAGARVGSAAA